MDGLSRLVAEARDLLRGPVRQLGGASVALAVTVAGLVARSGSPSARVSAAALVVAVALTGWALSHVLLRRRKGPRGTLLWLRRADAASADAALRALDLDERVHAGDVPGSPELARLHLARRIASISKLRVRDRATRQRRLFAGAALAVGVALAGVVVLGRLRVLEGLDVLVARGGVAPIHFTYLDELQIDVAPPDYLHLKGEHFPGPTAFDAHHGSVITVRGRVQTAGRSLVVTDGKTDVPFVDDGQDGALAHWTLLGPAELRVAARFGPVRIEQDERLRITHIADEAPRVTVKGAPRTHALADTEEVTLEYEASDDHALREVHLVLRSGADETRRVLSKLDSAVRSDKGAATLRPKDKVLSGAFLPVIVTVEGRDDDVLTGPKWGRSEPVTLVPVPVAALEAARMKDLLAARDALVDVLARAGERAAKGWAADVEGALVGLEAAARKAHGTLVPSDRLAAFVASEIRKVRSKETAPPTELEAALGRGVVALDRAISSLGTRDARAAAKKVSRIASYVADALGAARSGKNPHGREEADVAIELTIGAGRAMTTLGFLGEDLGGIVVGDHGRITRSLSKGDLAGAEAAARDLAARMANPVPSFMGGSGRGGGDAHGGQPEVGDDAGEDDEDAFDAEESALDRLIKDHGDNVDAIEDALRDASDHLRDELRRRAERLRGLAEELRGVRGTEAPAQSVDKMADAMERGDLGEAVKEGRAAEKALGAKQASPGATDQDDAERLLESLEREATRRAAAEGTTKLAPEVRWAEKAAEETERKRRDAIAKGKLEERERTTRERTSQLGKERGDDPKSVDLRRAGEAMKAAEDALRRGDGPGASDSAKEAQRALESAKRQKDPAESPAEPSDSAGDSHGDRGAPTGPVAIPKQHAGPDEFRRRVVEGMGRPASSRVKDAVKRYTERLLR